MVCAKNNILVDDRVYNLDIWKEFGGHAIFFNKHNLDKSLKRTNFEFSYLIPDYEKMVFELAQWVNSHKEMYPHYF